MQSVTGPGPVTRITLHQFQGRAVAIRHSESATSLTPVTEPESASRTTLRQRLPGGNPDAGECDVPETCDADGTCPVDSFEIAGATCTDTIADCYDAKCDGSGTCDQDYVASVSGTGCGDQTFGECDFPDSCNGTGVCQPNHAETTTPCGNPDAGECDVPETCDADGTCPVDSFEIAGATCTDTIADCYDAKCDGSGTCDQDYVASVSGTGCGDQTFGECDLPDSCNGAGSASRTTLSNDSLW